MSPSTLKIAPRTLSEVGRVARPFGLRRVLPLKRPATTLTGGRVCDVLRRERVHVGAEALSGGFAEQDVRRIGELGVGGEELLRQVAGVLQQLRVLRQARHLELRKPVLARTEHLPRTAQLQVDLRE